jgi:hypothetical protein
MAKWPLALVCGDCGASVGCHIDTDVPMGKMAVASTRMLRHMAHLAFDKIWKSGCMSRRRAQEWMASHLNLVCEFHISECTNRQLLHVINVSEEYCRTKGEHRIANERNQKSARTRRVFERDAKHNAIHAAKRRNARTRKGQRKQRNNRPFDNVLATDDCR